MQFELRQKAAMRLQRWIKRKLLQFRIRMAFNEAGPILTKTVKQNGFFFRCIVAHHTPDVLLFRMQTLPSKRMEQDLFVDLPESRSKSFDKKEYAQKMLLFIKVNQDGKVSFPKEAKLSPRKDNLLQLSFGETPKPVAGGGKKEVFGDLLSPPRSPRSPKSPQRLSSKPQSAVTQPMHSHSPIYDHYPQTESHLTDSAPRFQATITSDTAQVLSQSLRQDVSVQD